jgi:hypothetical protein
MYYYVLASGFEKQLKSVGGDTSFETYCGIVAPFASQEYIDDGSKWCSLAWRRWYLGVSLAYVLPTQ